MSVSSSSTVKTLNKVINKLDDSVLIPFGNNLDEMILIVEQHITITGNFYLDENLALLLTEFSASSADAFSSYLLNVTIDNKNIITISATYDGINFNFFSIFCTYEQSVLVGSSSAYENMLPYLYLCTKGIFNIGQDYGGSTIDGIIFSNTDELLKVYNNLVLVKNSLDTLMTRKAILI